MIRIIEMISTGKPFAFLNSIFVFAINRTDYSTRENKILFSFRGDIVFFWDKDYSSQSNEFRKMRD